jgi:diguanylate cyclase (GGDEF)-like protein
MNPTFSDEQIRLSFSELTHEYSLQDIEHNYYLYDITGTQYYNGETVSYLTVDMIHEKDYLNNLYIQEFVDKIAIDDTAAISYFDYLDEELTHFVLYGKKIESTSFIVANIVNMQVFSNELKLETINELNRKFESSDNTLFITDYDGTILYHPNDDLIGGTVNDENALLASALTTLNNFAVEKGEGFVKYDFYGNSIDGESKPKIAYLKSLDSWEIVLGSTVTQDKYDDIIVNYAKENFKLMLSIKVPSYIVMIILSLSIFLYLKSTIKESELIVEKEEMLYRKFANLTSEIILITNKQGEIIFSNNLGKKAIFGKRETTKNVFFDQILVEEEGYYILFGYMQDFFVKFVNETIDYNNIKAELFIITDVTEKIKTEKKLEALSLVDELTKLGNRRMMVKEYNEIVLPYVKSGKNAYFVMLDLDDFKSANDLYGHSYGDLVLKNVADIFVDNKDNNILVYRVGGDEFALIFLNYDKKDVIAKLEQMRKTVETYKFEKKITLSFSAGVTSIKVNDQKRRFSDYFDRADKLLYKSKNEGKHKTNS